MARPDFEKLDSDKEFDPPLDPQIAPVVRILRQNGVETCQSCQGGPGHSSLEPYVEFYGGHGEGPLAVGVALQHGVPVTELRRVWHISEHELTGPIWKLVLTPSGLKRFLKNC